MPAKDTVATVISYLRYRCASSDEDYRGRGSSCRDVEGHFWNSGTYDPWHPPQA
jgi:hypothetical protein